MASLLLRLVGPMQSWGTQSRFDERDSETEPTKSGVLGIVASSLGIDRAQPVDHLARLGFGTRVDRAGDRRVEYQTVMLHTLLPGQHPKNETKQTYRANLQDAAAWAALEGDAGLLSEIDAALRDPVWPHALGRKSYLPSLPVWSGLGVQDLNLLGALTQAPDLRADRRAARDRQPVTRVMLIEQRALPPEAAPAHAVTVWRRDQPTAPFAEARYAMNPAWRFAWTPPETLRPDPHFTADTLESA